MLSIHLKDLSFFSRHGLYEEEKVLGNTFVVNAHVHYFPKVELVLKLEETLNYETLFALVQKRMQEPSPLLETIAMELCYGILDTFEEVHATFVSIEKINPPIPSFNGSVVVSFQLTREEQH